MTWRDTGVSPSGTHHVRGGAPLYVERFDEVLKFHEPGLAPLSKEANSLDVLSRNTPYRFCRKPT